MELVSENIKSQSVQFYPCDLWRYNKWMYNDNGDVIHAKRNDVIHVEQIGGTGEFIDRGVNDDGSVYIDTPSFVKNPRIVKIIIYNP